MSENTTEATRPVYSVSLIIAKKPRMTRNQLTSIEKRMVSTNVPVICRKSVQARIRHRNMISCGASLRTVRSAGPERQSSGNNNGVRESLLRGDTNWYRQPGRR